MAASKIGFAKRVGRIFRWVVMFARLAVSAMLFLAVFGSIHPVGDSFSVIQLPIALFGLALSVFFFGRILRVVVLILSVLAIGQIGLEFLNSREAGPIAVYQKNLLSLNPEIPRTQADILKRQPEIVTLEEVTDQLAGSIQQGLAGRYPTWKFCKYNDVRGSAIASIWPEVAGSGFCAAQGNVAGIQVIGPNGPLWLVSLHLHWPWPYEQGDQVKDLLPTLEALEGPVVLGGDFNMLPWSNAVRQIAKAVRGERAGGVEPTFYLDSIPLPIDQVIAPAGGTIEVLPLFESDHHGLLAHINLTPDP